MKKSLLLFLALVLVLGVAGCGQPVASSQLVQSNKPRISQPSVSPTDQAALVEGNNTFAFHLYQTLRTEDGNLFYSPFSISEALAMTYAGARNQTEKDMASALNYTLPQANLHPAFNSIDLQLKSRGEGAKGKDGKGFRLNVVNAIWGQKDYKFLDSYLDVLAQNYGAGLRTLDFIEAPEQSRQTINQWVEEQTESRIKDLLPQGTVSKLTRLVLTNAIYFNAAWLKPFNKSATSDGVFTLLNGSKVMVPMMKESEDFKYIAGANYQAVELPYDGSQLSMIILLPAASQFAAFEKSVDWLMVKNITGNMNMTRVNLTMPKFEFESKFGLKQALASLGMPVAFTTNADFSGMNGNRDLFIHDVLHKAFVSVDEEGTQAAAATGVVVGVTSVPSNQAEMKIDRPFFFLIRDIPTGSIIFIGRVEDPTAK